MTVVAMMKGSDGEFYIGADSQWTDSEGAKTFKTKITILNSQGNIITWATAGNPQIGIVEFGNWVREYQRTETTTWQSFIEEAAGEFARLNRIRRQIGEKAGINLNDPTFKNNNLCEMLVCGWLNQSAAGYSIENDGNYQSLEMLGIFTIGTGAHFAEAVYKTLCYFQKELGFTEQQVFQYLMELSSHFAPQCSMPYEVVTISQGELQRYNSKEPEPGVRQIMPASQSETDNSGT